jgi:hypothetical protein
MRAVSAAVILSGCTTGVQPTTCAPGATSCAGVRDARFCEYLAVQTEGDDCRANGIIESEPFWVVTPNRCTSTTYVLENGDCRVLRYELLRDANHVERAAGAPMFVNR